MRFRFGSIGCALVALTLGLAVYAFARPETALTANLPPLAKVELPLTGSLPSAFLALAVVLLALAGSRTPGRPPTAPLLAWLSPLLALELLQAAPPDSLPAIPLLGRLAAGTFDPGDLLASAVGAASALLLYTTLCRGERRPAPFPVRRPLLAGLVLLATVATSPPPYALVESSLDYSCPGSSVTLWWYVTSGRSATLTASDPSAVDPPFEPVPVEGEGSMTVRIVGNVVFTMVPPGEGEPPPNGSAHVTVIEEEGIETVLSAPGECTGAGVEWSGVTVSEWDEALQVDTVAVAPASHHDLADTPLLVGVGESEAVVEPGVASDALSGEQFVGEWRIVPAEEVNEEICSEPAGSGSPTAAVTIRLVCPGERY